jgi:glycosyltransferase involved in cell wall biosynthesis/predicted SAM-dependent methyltransferase
MGGDLIGDDNLLQRFKNIGVWKEGMPLRLHLGCGERRLEGYINIDYPQSEHTVMQPSADFCADIAGLAFPPGTVDEVRLHHVFEHFDRVEGLGLLIKWHSWLRMGGIMRIETPDLIGSAKVLLSQPSWKTKMGIVRHLSGDHASSWGYHLDHWFAERFEHTLSRLGFDAIEARHTSWPHEPFLANVEITAVKTRHIPIDEQKGTAEKLLWDSAINTSPESKHTWQVWRERLDKFLRGETEGEPSALVSDDCLRAALARVLCDRGSQLPIDQITGFNQKSRDRWMAEEAANIPSGSRVLDVGAGTCPYRSLFSHCNYKSHDFKKLEKIELGDAQGYGQIDYVSDITSIPVADASFDVVVCTEVLEHTPDPIKAIAEVARILRPGGELLLAAPLGSGLHQLPFHFYGGFTPQWYKHFLPRFGLELLEIQPNGGFFKMLAQECARVAWTLPQHRALHGDNAEIIQYLFGQAIPRYLFALDERCFIDQFTVGYHIRAAKTSKPASLREDGASVCVGGSEVPPTRCVTALIFSKDRAMQLQGTIESFMLHCRDSDVADLVVLFKTSNELHRGQYERLREKFPAVTFVEETDFKRQVLSVVERCKYVLFLVDDNIFVNPFSLRDVIAALDSGKNAIGFSLRLGKNTHYCYMLSCRQKLPAFERVRKGILGYYWPGAERDFGYPLEVSSSVYRSNEILCLLSRLDFSNPNTLESEMSQNSKMFVSTVPVLLVFDESVTFCNPVNIVQSVYENNKFGTIRRYTPEQLADCFSRGMAIDVRRYIGFTPDSAHQEVELYFKSAGQPIPEAQTAEQRDKPKFSIVMANYNNSRYINQAIESVLSQTFRDWGLIIVDDCSTDDSVDIIKRYLTDDRICLIRHDTNKGYIAALKTAIAAVNSELFGILDSDDCLMAHAVETMYQHHINSPDCGLIYSQFMYCDEDLRPKQRGYCQAIPTGKTNLDVDTVSHFKTFKLRDYLKTPGCDESILYAEDKDISYKMEEVTRLKFVNECLYLYRELPHSQGNDACKRAIGKESMDRAKSAAIERRNRPLSAIVYFLKAKEEFQQGNFARASELLDEYRKHLDYSKLPRTLRTSRKPGDVGMSVIIVTCNRPDDLKKCLESLSKQDDLDFEVVVVDNGGSEFEQVKQYVDQYVKCPINFAPAEGRNIGVCCARGKIVAFLDDDALAAADFVSSVKVAFRTYDIFGLRGKVLPKSNPQANKDAWCYDRGPNAFPTLCDIEGCSAFRRDIFLSVNGMDPLLFGHEGLDLTYRIIKKFGALNKVIYWPSAVIYHDDASTAQAREANKRRCSLNEQYLRFKHNASIFALRETIEKAYLPGPPKVDVEMAAQAASVSPATSQQTDTPVVLVVYNRPKHTLEVLKALKHHNIKNLYIFSDAPKHREHEQSVSLVRRLIHSIDWTTPKIIERGENFGNARNLVSAVDCVFQEYDRLIVLEDDCVPQQFFFDFVYTCLEKYKDNPRVFGVTGHSVSVPDRLLQKYPYDLYFCPRSGSWGWATWKRAWQHYSGDVLKLVEMANEKGIDPAQGGTDFPISIEQFLNGRLKDVWDVQWALSVYLNNGYYVYPTRSHIKNIGTDGSGLHCSRTDKYDGRCADKKPSRYPNDVFIDNNILENFRSYFQADGEQSRRATVFLTSIGKSRHRPQIALVSTTDNRGGAARVAWTIKQGLKARGFATKMFVKERFSLDGDVHVITNPAVDGGDEYKKQGFLYYDIKSSSLLGRNRDLVSCDVFHFHNLHGDYFNPFDLPQLTGIKPSVWTLHDMQGLTGHCAHSFDCNRWQTGCGNCPDLQTYPAIAADQTAQMWRDKRNIYRACDIEVIVPSQWLKNIVEKSILRDKKVHLIYNGIDEQIYRPYDKSAVRRRLSVPEDAIVVGFASPKGLREQYKGGGFILEAYKYFVARYPNVYFLCIGGRAENAPAERFLQIPFITDDVALAQIYCAADLFMYPSIADNCPLIVLELMGCGIPVVSFKVGGVPELVEHGKTGFVAGYKNGGELIQLTEQLITDKVCRRQFGLASLERLRAKFTLGHLLDEHIHLYEGLLEESRRKNYFAEKAAAAIPTARTGDKAEYLVSAIVSTYNSEQFIRGCLEDLENQTIADRTEIVVVNSGSQQNEEQIVREFQRKYDNIVYIRTGQRETVYAAWNRAARAAKGEFLTNANTDDRHRKDALEIMAKTLLANPDIALVYGDQIVTDTPNPTFENHHAVEIAKRPKFSKERLLFGCCVGSQPMWRKSLHDEFGGFDETLTCAADWDFWLKAAQKYNFRHIPESLGLYYHNEEGIEHGRKIHGLYERYAVGRRYGNPYISVIQPCEARGNPLVSVVMAAYNAAVYIAGAIESVLIQNYRNFELVVVDDGSTDNTADIVRGFKHEQIKCFSRENSGAASARNLAIQKSGGSFIVVLDSDDMMTPDFLAGHLQVFEQHPEADLVYCDDCLIDEKDKPIRVIERPEYSDRKLLIADLFRCGFPIVPFRTCVRKSVFDKIGLYDERLIVAEDYDMIGRFVKHGLKAYHLPAALYLRRLTIEGLSRKFNAAKAKSQFEAISRFTGTFTPEELFPDVQWDKLPSEQRPLLAKCKAAIVYLAIGQEYAKTGAEEYARAAYDLACSEIGECLKIDPENNQVRRLSNSIESVRGRYYQPLEQVSPVVV